MHNRHGRTTDHIGIRKGKKRNKRQTGETGLSAGAKRCRTLRN